MTIPDRNKYASPIMNSRGDNFNIRTNRTLLSTIPVYTSIPLHTENDAGEMIHNIATLNFHVCAIYGRFTALMFNTHHYITDHYEVRDEYVLKPYVIQSGYDSFISIVEDAEQTPNTNLVYSESRLNLLYAVVRYIEYKLGWEYVQFSRYFSEDKKKLNIYDSALSSVKEFTQLLYRFDKLKAEIDLLSGSCSKKNFLDIISKLMNVDRDTIKHNATEKGFINGIK